MKNFPFKNIPSLLLASVLAVVVVIGGSLSLAQRAQAGADDREIKDIALKAFNTSVTFGKVEHVVGATKTPPSEDLTISLNSNDIEATREQAHVTMERMFGKKCNVCSMMAQGVDDGLTAEGKGVYRIVASGTRDIDWRQVTINGDSASATLAATTWIKTVSRNEFGKVEVQTPEEGRVKLFTFAKENGHWVITNVVQDQVSTGELPINKQTPSPAKNGDQIPAKPSSAPQGGVKDTSTL